MNPAIFLPDSELIEAILSLRPTVLHVSDHQVVRDLSGGGWHATYTGSPTLTSPLLPGVPRGLTWSGSGQYATTSGSVPTPAESVSVLAIFAMTDSTAAIRYLAGRNATNQSSWGLSLGTTHLARFAAFRSGGSNHCTITGGSGLNDGATHTIVGSFDGTTARVGVDGGASFTSTSIVGGTWHKTSTAGISLAALGTTGLCPGSTFVHAYWVDRVVTDAERADIHRLTRAG